MVNFSVCLIAKNESKTLPRAIESLKFCDDIWLLDTGSIDNTVEVAKSFLLNIVEKKFLIELGNSTVDEINNMYILNDEIPILKYEDKIFDFAAARNYIASFTKHDMILVLDCDEIYTKLDLDKICNYIENGVDQFEYEYVWCHDQHNIPTVKYNLCKFYNKKKLKWVNIVHEVLEPIEDVKINKMFVNDSIIYLEHWQNELSDRSEYLKGLALDFYQNPDNDKNCQYLANELKNSGRLFSAIEMYKHHIMISKDKEHLCFSYTKLGEIAEQQNRGEEAVKYYLQAFNVYSKSRTPLMNLVEYYKKKNDYQKMVCYCSMILEIKPDKVYCNVPNSFTLFPHENLYLAQHKLGNKEGAKHNFDICYRIVPSWYEKDKKLFYLEEKIPKKIFSIWLNDNSIIPDLIQKCINSHKIPNYVYNLITLDNYPKGIKYLDNLIKNRNWVKAADYLRMYYLYKEGGIYLDADVEILPNKNFDQFLNNEMFVVDEGENRFIANSIVGSKLGHTITGQYLEIVVSNSYHKNGPTFEAGMGLFTSLIYGADKQILDIKVYDREYFLPYNHQTGTTNITDKTITNHYYMKSWVDYPLVSIIIPTLGRPEGLKRCLDSIEKLNYPKDKVDLIVLDGEDTVPNKMKKGLGKSKGKLIVYGSNDIKFTPDSLKIAVEESKHHGLVAFNTGTVLPDEGNICEHFLIKKDIIDKIDGEIFDTEFNHIGVDNLLWAKCKKINEAYRSTRSIINHYHFSTGKSEFDDVYKKGWEKREQDRELLRKKLETLYLSK